MDNDWLTIERDGESVNLTKCSQFTYDVTNNLVAENDRKSQKYAENVIFCLYLQPKSGSGVPTFIVILRPYFSLKSLAIRQNCRP